MCAYLDQTGEKQKEEKVSLFCLLKSALITISFANLNFFMVHANCPASFKCV